MNRTQLTSLFSFSLLLAALAAGCSSAATVGPAPVADIPTAAADGQSAQASPEERITNGLKAYSAHYCATCHQLTIADSNAPFGPSFDNVGATAEHRIHDHGYTGTATTAEEYLRESILTPKAYIVDGYQGAAMPMPTIKLSEEEVNDLVQMLLLQK